MYKTLNFEAPCRRIYHQWPASQSCPNELSNSPAISLPAMQRVLRFAASIYLTRPRAGWRGSPQSGAIIVCQHRGRTSKEAKPKRAQGYVPPRPSGMQSTCSLCGELTFHMILAPFCRRSLLAIPRRGFSGLINESIGLDSREASHGTGKRERRGGRFPVGRFETFATLPRFAELDVNARSGRWFVGSSSQPGVKFLRRRGCRSSFEGCFSL